MATYIGDMIKMLRQSNNMSQDELGKRIGVGRAAVNKYEKGVIENIPIKTIEHLANIFNVSPGQLLGWDEGKHIGDYQQRVMKGLEYLYGEDIIEVIDTFVGLSKPGQKKVIQYLDDIERLYSKE